MQFRFKSFSKLKYWQKIALFFALLIFFTQLTNTLSGKFFFNKTSFETPPNTTTSFKPQVLPLINSDGRNYLNITLFGYKNPDKTLAFFPLYPNIVKAFSLNNTLSPILIGIIVAGIFSFFACLILYKLVILEGYSQKTALKTILIFLCFPSSFFLISYYPEGVFLFLTLSVFYFLKKRRYLLAAIFTGFATATRLIGVALLPVILWEGYQYYKREKRLPYFLIFAPLGIIFYALFIQLTFGDFRYILSSQTDKEFGRTLHILNPIQAFKDSLNSILAGPLPRYDNIFVYPVIILEFLLGVFELILLKLSFKKINLNYWIYSFFSILIVLLSGMLTSNVRHLLLVFPFFIYLAKILKGGWFYTYLTISILLFLFCATVFLRGYFLA